jgi:glutamyl/glutaminyl-tRNA synthetase
MSDKELKIILDRLEKILAKIKESDWTKENLEEILILESEKPIFGPEGEKGERGKLLWPFRVALTGMKASAGPFEIAEILGKQKTLIRLKEAKQKL